MRREAALTPSFGAGASAWPSLASAWPWSAASSASRSRHTLLGVGIEWVGIAIDCEWAAPMASFYEGLLGLEIRDLGPGGRWAQLFNPNGGVHMNIQGDPRYRPPTWPEQPGELTKMLHLERGHGERFTKLMDQAMPDWRGRRDCLNDAPLGPEEWAPGRGRGGRGD